jgi:hypothetical protein
VANHFDAAALLAAMERPTLTVPPRRPGGRPRTFTGGFLSIEQWARLEERVREMQAGTLPVVEIQRLIRDMTDEVFGRPPWWAPWRAWPAVELARLPLGVQLEALNAFIASQVTALNRSATTPPAPVETSPAAAGTPASSTEATST